MARREIGFAINSLTDLFGEPLSLALRLRQLRDFGDPTELRRQILMMLQTVDSKGRRMEYARQDIEDAKFALVAYLDELVLVSGWAYKEEWSIKPLQLELYGTNVAGEEFFARLDKYLVEQPARSDVLEMYFLCLTLGFQGRYSVVGREKLRGLIQDVRARLSALKPSYGADLSPNWKPDAISESPLGLKLPLWAIPALCFLGLILVILLSDAILGTQVSALVNP